jgi:hypothetical protein
MNSPILCAVRFLADVRLVPLVEKSVSQDKNVIDQVWLGNDYTTVDGNTFHDSGLESINESHDLDAISWNV